MKVRPVIFVSFLLCAANANAEEKIDCKKTAIQPELNECAATAYLKSDADLNKLYAGTLRGLDRNDAERLRAAQREWVKFRDAECLYRAGGEEAEGIGASMGPMIDSMCREKLTKQRIEQLRQDAEGPE